ncbi:MAG: hypothetical protein H6Q15_2215 [Bacteroidetes bacterium]|nr:hypothetical protein [Bacteroidota bacterium]
MISTNNKNMNNLGIKATIYDITGYAIPGFLTIISIFMIIKGEVLDINAEINFKVFNPYIQNNSFLFYVLIFVLSYIAGHIIESISSLVYKFLKKYIFKKCFSNHYEEINKKANEKYEKDFNDCEQNLISLCQVKYPIVYDTAFVFLTFYGLARNTSISLLIILITLILNACHLHCSYNSPINCCLLSGAIIILLITIGLLGYNSFRFRKYFELKIISTLYLVDDTNLQNNK